MALHLAVKFHKVACVKALLAKGSDPGIPNHLMQLPIHLACGSMNGMTALMMAIKKKEKKRHHHSSSGAQTVDLETVGARQQSSTQGITKRT